MRISEQAMNKTTGEDLNRFCLGVGGGSPPKFLSKAQNRLRCCPSQFLSKGLSESITSLVIKHEIATSYRWQMKGSKLDLHIAQEQLNSNLTSY